MPSCYQGMISKVPPPPKAYSSFFRRAFGSSVLFCLFFSKGYIFFSTFSILFFMSIVRFVNHFRKILTKEADLEVHRSVALNFTAIIIMEQRVKPLDPSTITVTRVSLNGNAGTDSIEEKMC